MKRPLYARHGLPCYWIVDPDAHVIEAYVLTAGPYELVAELEGGPPQALPAFPDLPIDPAAICV